MKIKIIIGLVFLISCGTKKLSLQDDINDKAIFDTSIIAILHPSQYTPFKDKKPAVLNQKDFQVIDSILKQAIEQYNTHLQKQSPELKKDDELFIRLKNYKQQYVPVINEQGEKEVWINCFCNDGIPTPDWKTHLEIVFDGGDCYFDIRINLTTKKAEALSVNGYG